MEQQGRFAYLIKNIGILTISNFASKVLVFFLLPLYTSILSTIEYGTYDLIVSTVEVVFPLLTLNITDAVLRFTMEKNQKREDVVAIGLRYILKSMAIVAVFLIICDKIQILTTIRGFGILIFLYYIFFVWNQFLIQLAKGMELVKDMGIAGVISTVVMLGCNILFLVVFKWGMVGFFVANILAQALPAIYLLMRLKLWQYFHATKIDGNIRRQMLVYCVPLVFTTVGWWINSAADKYIVTFFCGVAANGILSVAYKVPSILNTLQGIFVQAWQISAIKEYGTGKAKEFYGETFIYMNFLMCMACSVLIIISRPLRVLYGVEFVQAWRYVPFLLIAGVLNAASGFLGPILAAAKESKCMAKSAICGAIANLLFNVILIYYIGIQGATVATAISSFIIFYVRKKGVGNRIEIISEWKIYFVWGMLVLQALLEICDLNILGYLLEGGIIIIVLGMHVKQLKLLKEKIVASISGRESA